jgi:Fe-S oxidoreductase
MKTLICKYRNTSGALYCHQIVPLPDGAVFSSEIIIAYAFLRDNLPGGCDYLELDFPMQPETAEELVRRYDTIVYFAPFPNSENLDVLTMLPQMAVERGVRTVFVCREFGYTRDLVARYPLGHAALDCTDIVAGLDHLLQGGFFEAAPQGPCLHLDDKAVPPETRLYRDISILDVPEVTNDPAYKTHPEIRSQRWYLIGSGCARHCSFCLWNGSCHRNRDLNILEREFEWLEGGAEYCHPNLFWKRSWNEDYLNRIRRFPSKSYLKGTAHIADLYACRDLLPAWRDVGLHTLSVGIESAHERVLSSIGKTDNDMEKLREVSRILRDLDMELYVNLIIGLPEDGNDSLKQTYDLMGEMGFYTSCCSFLVPYPGTKVYHEILDSGLCTAEDLSLERHMDFYANRKRTGERPRVRTRHIGEDDLCRWYETFRSKLHGNPMDI